MFGKTASLVNEDAPTYREVLNAAEKETISTDVIIGGELWCLSKCVPAEELVRRRAIWQV